MKNSVSVTTAIFTLWVGQSFVWAQTGPGGVGETDGSSDLELWLKADAGVTKDGSDRVSAWADQSGNGRNATQSTSDKRPTYYANQQNGQPVLRLDGTNYMDNTYRGVGGTELTFFIVAKGSVYASIIRFQVAATPYIVYPYEWDKFIISSDGGTTGISHGLQTNVWNIGTACYKANTSNGMRTYRNGGLVAQRNSADVTLPSEQLTIGRSPLADNEYTNADVAEITVYSSALNTIQRTLVENSLSTKYNISLSSGDKYAGDDTGNGDYDYDVAGIGKESDGTYTEAHSAGLVIMDNGSLNTDGDYLLCGHDGTANSVVTSDLPGGVIARWQRVWFLDKTGSLDGANVKLAFDFSEGGMGGTPSGAGNYRLLNRASTSGTFSEVTTANTSISGDQVIFEVADAHLTDAYYYTIGTTHSESSLPVGLSSLTATAGDGQVTLRWTTESEIDNLGFHVYRALAEDGKYERLTEEWIAGAGNSASGREYAFTDVHLTNGVTYWYKIEDTAFDGAKTMHGPLSITPQASGEIVVSLPDASALAPCYPNPFNPNTTIRYQLSEPGYVRLAIYDLLGRKVRTLADGLRPAGYYSILWDGRDDWGRKVGTGVYLSRMDAKDFVGVSKMLKLE